MSWVRCILNVSDVDIPRVWIFFPMSCPALNVFWTCPALIDTSWLSNVGMSRVPCSVKVSDVDRYIMTVHLTSRMWDPSSLRVKACGRLLGSHRRNASLPIGKRTITDRTTTRRGEARKNNNRWRSRRHGVHLAQLDPPLEFLGKGFSWRDPQASPADPSPSRGNPGGALAMEPLGPSVSTLGLPVSGILFLLSFPSWFYLDGFLILGTRTAAFAWVSCRLLREWVLIESWISSGSLRRYMSGNWRGTFC